ncbi:hypothetical protein KNV09_gp111 [Vibrio phage Athena]|uniref:Uncharacterized protein n=5 Tax=Thalassavirus TaxID=2948922 RepID=A0A4Y6E816_9CAUD|nr:hypothetical protein KNU52_gp093 [Vibrio phage Achelous]YP_010102609.1 hypothetical protein KNU58_gp096 [Vibrio phage Brizo]YP_010105961.1 hypothetical protein KNU88_gp111 [Vibrio phage Chester]YP_010108606.1 hypothetical protein KNV08_gp114 [Vibrio phage Quinn]YP_010108799.1 hypothetical protein KNV09_gp111 [Vibrio phage Athena]QIG66489.1 hypothetical protein CHAZLY21_198 [Vibrio phage Chazly21]QQO90012.1 hypothetical protein ABURR_202 [Vibrio phage ABurr]WBF69549.1 hypothetical protein 
MHNKIYTKLHSTYNIIIRSPKTQAIVDCVKKTHDFIEAHSTCCNIAVTVLVAVFI